MDVNVAGRLDLWSLPQVASPRGRDGPNQTRVPRAVSLNFSCIYPCVFFISVPFLSNNK